MNGKMSLRVLVAEDDYLVTKMIEGLLDDLGYTVVGRASNGLEAVELAASLHPDVILMDIKMPDLDGLKATEKIQSSCPTPVVILTAYETAQLVEQAGQVGVGAYLVKPPRARELERAIIIATARFDDMLELRRLNAELQEANAELDAFAHTLAHDLRYLLSPILSYSEVLYYEYGHLFPDEIKQDLLIIAQSARDMNNLVGELLLLAGVGYGSVTITPLDMDKIVKEVRRRLSYLIVDHEAQVVGPNYWPTALGYTPWVEEVWVNYISNAVKYGGELPFVELGATPEGDMIRFWVVDHGEGIASDDLPRLFKPFAQLDQLSLQGHGLGLSIVRRIVEKLGGEVDVKSEVKKGSTFSFTLPVVK
jgi:two-component system, sensor histidine kinase and response regulator